MPTRTSSKPPARYDATVQRGARNVFDRDPILIPQLFEDGPPPWYRRRAGITLAIVALLCLAGLAFAVQQFGFAGTAKRAGSIAVAVPRAFARAF